MNKTYFLKKEDIKERKWYVFDASGKILGRFASQISKVLRGKHKPDFTPHIDSGDGVIIINAEKIKVTGFKEARKEYTHYTGWIGGLKRISYRKLQEKYPERILLKAIKGMMPTKSKLTRAQLKRLRIVKGEDHNMIAQNPKVVNI